MTRKLTPLLILLLLSASVYAAHAIGLGEGNRFGHLGSLGNKKAAAPATPCNGTGLIFTQACNSQYIGIL
jgi:hypothetical protein